jgi:hypothetical protein
VSADPAANNALVETLGSALRYGGAALSDVPELLERTLREGAWKRFVTQRGELVEPPSFSAFVADPPLRGLGANDALIDRLVGTDRPELLRLVRDARKVGAGHRSDLQPHVDSTSGSRAEDSTYTAQRLAEQAPDEYEAVQRGEKTLNAAARAAGIRRPRIMVRLDDPESAAATLRKHMQPEVLARLKELL